MQIEIRSSFAKDSKKLPINIKADIAEAIGKISMANSFLDIPDIKAMKGGKSPKCLQNAYQ